MSLMQVDPTLLNPLEMREWLEDMGSEESNIGFTVISTYRGRITTKLLTDSLRTLAELHPLLRTTFKVSEQIPKFFELKDFQIPITTKRFNSKDQWRGAAKRDLKERFNKEDQPLWRVSFLKGEQKGQILLTFHHAIADGVCAVEIMNHLYKIMSAKKLTKEPNIQFDSTLPPLKNLFPLIKKTPEKQVEQPVGTQVPHQGPRRHTNFVMNVIDETLAGKVLEWSKKNDTKVHSVLAAAFMQAVKTVKKHSFEEIDLISFVNYRPYFEPQEVSKEVARVLTSAILSKIHIGESKKFVDIAKELHTDLHTKLQEGEHIVNLKELIALLERKPTAQEILQLSISTPNEHVITNIGKVDFDGKYDCKDLSMEEIFFVANIDPYYQHPNNIGLSVVTFQNRIYLAAFFVEELFKEKDGRAVLEQLKKNLSTHCDPSHLAVTTSSKNRARKFPRTRLKRIRRTRQQ